MCDGCRGEQSQYVGRGREPPELKALVGGSEEAALAGKGVQNSGCWKKAARGRGWGNQGSGETRLCGPRLSVGGSGGKDGTVRRCRWGVGQSDALVDDGGASNSGGRASWERGRLQAGDSNRERGSFAASGHTDGSLL